MQKQFLLQNDKFAKIYLFIYLFLWVFLLLFLLFLQKKNEFTSQYLQPIAKMTE